MNPDPNIAELQARIAKAEADQDTWRASGNQEKYLEAFSLAGALALELDKLRRRRLEAAPSGDHFRPVDVPPAPKAGQPPRDARERERLMAEYSIALAGGQYQFSHYRYDRFEDALGYAMKQRAAPSASDAADSLPPARVLEAPDAGQQRLMAMHGITFDGGVYHLGPYRYDRLADAMDYAGVLARVEAFPGSIRNPMPKASPS